MKISFIGDLTIDWYPQLKQEFVGGASLISAMWAKRLGAEATILAAVGNDEAGEKFKTFFRQNNLSLKHLNILNSPTSKIEILVDKNGERSFPHWYPGAMAKYHLSQKDIDFLMTQDAVVLPVYYKTRHLFEELLKLEVRSEKLDVEVRSGKLEKKSDEKNPISHFTPQILASSFPFPTSKPLIIVDFDDLSQFGKETKIIEGNLKYIDIVKLGLDEKKDKVLIKKIENLAFSSLSSRGVRRSRTTWRSSNQMIDCHGTLRVPRNDGESNKLFLITLGRNGSLVFVKGKTYRQKAQKVKVKNTNGAGDAFLAGFLFEYLKNLNPLKSLKSGSVAAAKAISQTEAF